MYYNSSGPGQSHYNYTAVQGAGSPDSRAYECSSNAYDYYNAKGMYADHALGGLGTYAEEQGINQQDGRVDFHNELVYGKRDMCDKNFLDFPGHPRQARNVFGLSKMTWMMLFAVALFLMWNSGRLNFQDRNTQIVIALAALLFFF